MWMDGEMLLQKLFQCNELVGLILVKQLKWLTWSCSVKVFEDMWKCLMLRKVILINLLGVILPTEPIRQMGVCEAFQNLKHDWNVDHPERWSSLCIPMPTLPCFSQWKYLPSSKWSFLQLKEKTVGDFMWNLVLRKGSWCFLCSLKRGSPYFLHGTVSLMARCFQVTFLQFQLRCSFGAGSIWAPKLPFL